MSAKQLHIGPGFQIPAIDYANQANAVLGIREAGKTYTAMKLAEELLECDIPIMVFDPVGVWKNLKIGTGKHKGYPVVVAGGEGADIQLTKENAVDIVRAAMKENVSLVLDFYSPALINKSTWISIVQSVVDLLMYENKDHGLRHIYIEEAAEFIPQKLQPQHNRVYASLERLARMGRNAKLGMTIINQRAEEVNKAILEICELSLIHKQVGKNSMLSIQKWLEVRQLEGVKEIIKSLPLLKKGECWAIGLNDHPQRIQVGTKKTYHPNPKADETEKLVGMLKRDVKDFVAKMNKRLVKEPEMKMVVPDKRQVSAAGLSELMELRKENARLKEDLQKLEAEAGKYKGMFEGLKAVLLEIKGMVDRPFETIKVNAKYADGKIKTTSVPVSFKPEVKVPVRPAPSAGNGSLGKCSRELIKFLAQYPDRQFSKAQVAIATGYSAGSGGFNNALSELNQKGFIIRGGKLQVNTDAMAEIVRSVGTIQHQDYNIETYRNNLGKCEREIYDVLIASPRQSFTKEELSQATETQYSAGSGGFNNALSRLNTLELIERQNGQIRLNPELLELMGN